MIYYIGHVNSSLHRPIYLNFLVELFPCTCGSAYLWSPTPITFVYVYNCTKVCVSCLRSYYKQEAYNIGSPPSARGKDSVNMHLFLLTCAKYPLCNPLYHFKQHKNKESKSTVFFCIHGFLYLWGMGRNIFPVVHLNFILCYCVSSESYLWTWVRNMESLTLCGSFWSLAYLQHVFVTTLCIKQFWFCLCTWCLHRIRDYSLFFISTWS